MKAKTKFEIVAVGIIIVAIGYTAFSSRPQQVEAQRTVVIDGDLYRASDLFRSARLSNSKDIRMLFEEKNGMMLVGKGYEGSIPNTEQGGSTQLYLYSNDGTAKEKMVSEKSDVVSAIFDKNAENIFYSTIDANLYKYNIQTKQIKLLAKDMNLASLSPDGKELVYLKLPLNWTMGESFLGFALLNIETGKEIIVPNTNHENDYRAVFTPDGKRLFFFSGFNFINLDGTGRKSSFKDGYYIDSISANIVSIGMDNPLWSKDGRYFLYEGNNNDILLIEIDTKNSLIISIGQIAYGTNPQWLEEGKTISVLSPDAKAGAPALSIVDLNGKVISGDKSHEKDYYSLSKGAFRRVAPKPVPPPPPPEPPREIPWKSLSPKLQKESKNIQSSDIPKEIPANIFKPTTQ